jgi:hypothetical protein
LTVILTDPDVLAITPSVYRDNGETVERVFELAALLDPQVELSVENAPEGGIYYVRLVHNLGNAGAYTLRHIIQRGGYCLDDELEPNNSAEVASEVALPAFFSARACQGDEDWFTWGNAPSADLSINVYSYLEGDPLGVEFYSEEGEILLRDTSQQTNKTLRLDDAPAGVRTRVFALEEGTKPHYALEVNAR